LTVTEKKPLVLIADDEQNAVTLLTRILERDGFAVESARDGEVALEKARSLRPDLILMDVQMPKLNGFEVTERLRQEAPTARIPVIFVTAAAREPSDVAHGFKLGADDYIRKPYNYHELLARARSKMRARQLEDRLQRRTEELEALVEIGREFNQRLGLNELASLIVAMVGRKLQAEFGELFLFDEQRQCIHYQDTQSIRSLGDAQGLLAQEQGVVNFVFQSEEPLLVADNEDPSNSSSLMAAPLKHHGRLVGIITVVRYQHDPFTENDLRLLRSIGEQAALAVRNAQLYAELQSYAQNLEAMVDERTEELRTAQAQLIRTEKLAALGRLAAGIAHEVNNPLQPILNCLDMAIEDTETGNTVDTEVLRVAEKEVQRIKTIVSRLLDFARPNTKDSTEVDLHELIHEVVVLTAKQLERMRVRIETRLRPVDPLEGSPTQLKQVLLNLVLNAAEAMPGGGELLVEVYGDESGATLAVTDTGIGMDSNTVARIFDPFFSTKDEGSGLGLAVSYGIVQGHGGDIHVESHPGKGSRFAVWLPYHAN
jgi:signal transduction histidine kinase